MKKLPTKTFQFSIVLTGIKGDHVAKNMGD